MDFEKPPSLPYSARPIVLAIAFLSLGTAALAEEVRLENRLDRSRVAAGSKLVLQGESAVLEDDVAVEGTLVLEPKHLAIPSRFTHERTITVRRGGLLELRGLRLTPQTPVNLHVEDGGSLIVSDVRSDGAPLSIGLRKGSTATIRRALALGELIADPGSQLRIDESRGFAVWLVLSEDFGELSLPEGKAVSRWRWQRGADIEITESREVLWAALTTPGAKGTFSHSELRAVGLVFGGRFRVKIDGLRNRELPPNGLLQLPDRRLAFRQTTVEAWNVYVVQSAHLEVRNSLLGEAWAFQGSGSLHLIDSHVDGSGGNVRAQGATKLRIERSTVSSDLVADDQARVEVHAGHIARSVHARDQSRIELFDVEVEGQVHAASTATIVRH